MFLFLGLLNETMKIEERGGGLEGVGWEGGGIQGKHPPTPYSRQLPTISKLDNTLKPEKSKPQESSYGQDLASGWTLSLLYEVLPTLSVHTDQWLVGITTNRLGWDVGTVTEPRWLAASSILDFSLR